MVEYFISPNVSFYFLPNNHEKSFSFLYRRAGGDELTFSLGDECTYGKRNSCWANYMYELDSNCRFWCTNGKLRKFADNVNICAKRKNIDHFRSLRWKL